MFLPKGYSQQGGPYVLSYEDQHNRTCLLTWEDVEILFDSNDLEYRFTDNLLEFAMLWLQSVEFAEDNTIAFISPKDSMALYHYLRETPNGKQAKTSPSWSVPNVPPLFFPLLPCCVSPHPSLTTPCLLTRYGACYVVITATTYDIECAMKVPGWLGITTGDVRIFMVPLPNESYCHWYDHPLI